MHVILGSVQGTDGFTTRYIAKEQIAEIVESIFNEVWESVYSSMEMHFPDSYPAHIFKTVGRLKKMA